MYAKVPSTIVLTILLAVATSCGYTTFPKIVATEPRVPQPARALYNEELRKVHPYLVQAAAKYETLRNPSSAKWLSLNDTLVMPITRGRIFLIFAVGAFTPDLFRFLRDLQVDTTETFQYRRKIQVLATASPQVVWHLAMRNDVDTIFTAGVLDRRHEPMVY